MEQFAFWHFRITNFVMALEAENTDVTLEKSGITDVTYRLIG